MKGYLSYYWYKTREERRRWSLRGILMKKGSKGWFGENLSLFFDGLIRVTGTPDSLSLSLSPFPPFSPSLSPFSPSFSLSIRMKASIRVRRKTSVRVENGWTSIEVTSTLLDLSAVHYVPDTPKQKMLYRSFRLFSLTPWHGCN